MSTTGRTLVIGSRGSRLALAQSGWVASCLEASGVLSRIEVIKTTGDRLLDQSLAVIGGQGLFVKEIEEELLAGHVDLAVHSLKDLPTAQPEGLTIACVPVREDPRDLLLARGGVTLLGLPQGAVLGTGSPRRATQALARRPDLAIKNLRGNVETRIAKWERGDYDAILLASAGVRRLGLTLDAIALPVEEMVPAVGQGALAIETRIDDASTRACLAPFHHPGTAAAVAAERSFLATLGGGCQAPIAALAEERDGRFVLVGLVSDADGRRLFRGQREGLAVEAASLGERLAGDLLAQGAGEALRRAAASRPPAEGA